MFYAIGDIHGCLEKLRSLLETANLIDANAHWIAGHSKLVFLGDYMDRGEDGIGVLDLIMRLEQEAKKAGGEVIALLGNHDLILLEVLYFGEQHLPSFLSQGKTLSFKQMWLENAGGQLSDYNRLEPKHVHWLQTRPVMHQIADTLFLHADSEFYLEYGARLEEINRNIQAVITSGEIHSMDLLEERFATRKAFIFDTQAAKDFANFFDVKRLVHGHTTIFNLARVSPKDVTAPFIYADGICVNLDHGLCYGGQGFVYRLPSPTQSLEVESAS